MKKFLIIFLSLIFVISLSCCAKGMISCPPAEGTLEDTLEGTSEAETPDKVEDSVEDSNKNILSSDMISQAVYDALQAEWSAWNAKDEMQKMVSSHLPGHIYKQFDTWAECEEFVGIDIFNPLEDSEFEKGSYVGMPVGSNDASRFYISFYGESPEKVNWIHVESGYRDGEVRIMVYAQISMDIPKENLDNQEPLITEDSGELYVATEALFARESITYTIRAIGGKGEWDAVRKTLNKVLPYFDKSYPPDTPVKPESEKITEVPTTIVEVVPEEPEPEMVKRSLLDFLKTAIQPIGKTMYVWGGGWNEEDTEAGVEAVTLGMSPAWEAFALQQDENYDYKKFKYQIHDGLDCSGYVGWVVYNLLETENGKEGYVLTTDKIAENYAARGLGDYLTNKEIDQWRPGDIVCMKGHAWICVGVCEDGSVLVLHCSPPGVAFCGTKLPDGSKSQAVILAEHIMQTYYPDWYLKYPRCSRSHSYLTDSVAMRWSRDVLSDEEQLWDMSAKEIVSLLFEQEN